MKRYLLILSMLVFTGCAYSGLVTMNAEGRYTIEELSAEKESSIYYAKWRANNYCKKQKKMAAILKEETVYQGILDEKVADAARRAEDVVWKTGSSYPAAQVLGSVTSNEDYKTEIEFECR